MSNAKFDNAAGAILTGDLDVLVNELRAYAVDMTQAGPAPGAWTVSAASLAGTTPERARISTSVAHGVAVGNLISFFGGLHTYSAFNPGGNLTKGAYRVPTVANGKKYRVIVGGTAGGSEPTWPTVDGEEVISGSAVLRCDGPSGVSVLNGLHRVLSVYSEFAFEIAPPSTAQIYYTSGGRIANLSKTYLSEFAPPAALSPPSDPFTGKTVLAGSVLDATGADPIIDLTGEPASQVVVIAQYALTNGGAALADTAQRLFLYHDTASFLPFAANAGVVSLPVSNGPDRMVRL